MALKDDIASFLRNEYAVSMINFQFRSTSITSNMYKVIAYHLESGRLKVKEKAQAKNVGANYTGKGVNTIFVAPHFKIASSMFNQMTIIHECTHAIIDYRKIGKHDFAEDEASAYVAAAVFSLYKNMAALTPAVTFDFSTLTTIARKMVIDGAHQVDESDAIDLMLEIRMDKLYRGSRDYASDGY